MDDERNPEDETNVFSVETVLILNAWVAMRDDVQAALDTRLTWDTETQGDYTGPVTDRTADIVASMQDRGTVQVLYRIDNVGGRDWSLWSIYLTQDDLDYLVSEYPATQAIVGVWHLEGNMLGTTLQFNEISNPEYVGEPYMIPNPAYQPDPELPDYDPRTEIRNPAWVPEFITEKSQTGTPTYPLHARALELMPDVDDIGTRPTEMSDVNLRAGQGTRLFS